MTAAARKTAADKQRELRETWRRGYVTLPVKVKLRPLAEALCDAGLLAEWDNIGTPDRQAVSAAVSRVLEVWIGTDVACNVLGETRLLDSASDLLKRRIR